jgi:hypothetical protein
MDYYERSSIQFFFVAVENGTYWAAARYLEAERVDPDRTHTSVVTNFYHPMRKAPQPQTSKSSSKRKAGLPAASSKRHKNNNREDAIEQMQQIVDAPCDATEDRIYETCPYIIEQVRFTFRLGNANILMLDRAPTSFF